MKREPVNFYNCPICGNIVGMIKNGGGELCCCGKPMEILKANVVEASKEKHIPVVKDENGKLIIQVGAEKHPMTEEHFIEWIAVANKEGTQRYSLEPGHDPSVSACSVGSAEVYAYCNLHGLWKTTI